MLNHVNLCRCHQRTRAEVSADRVQSMFHAGHCAGVSFLIASRIGAVEQFAIELLIENTRDVSVSVET